MGRVLEKVCKIFGGSKKVVEPPVTEPPPRSEVPDLLTGYRTWETFVRAIAMRESSDNYTAKNRYGYLGRYQFGLARLTDLGLCERIPGTVGWSNKVFRWKTDESWSEELFLASPGLQDRIFELHVGMHKKFILDKYRARLGHKVNGVRITLSGTIACFHLLGHGGFQHFLKGEDASDANGTMASDYLTDFENYEIPSDLPEHPKYADLKQTYEGIA